MKKFVTFLLCLVMFVGCFALFVGCERKDEPEEDTTFIYEGKTAYLIGEDFEDGEVVGNTGTRYKVTAEDVSYFSTEEAIGNTTFEVTVAGHELAFPYYVCKEVTPLKQEDAVEENGVYIFKDLEYGDFKDDSPYIAELSFYTSQTARDQIFDAYLPAKIGELKADTPVLLYVHGGAWIMADKDMEGPALCKALAKAGFAVFSMNYNMQKIFSIWDCTMDDILSDIGIMNAYLKNLLPTLGIRAEKIAIGGVSAGGHLSTLYAYTKNDYSPLKIGFELDIVGPTQFGDENYKPMIESMLAADLSGITSTSRSEQVKAILSTALPNIIKGLIGVEAAGFDLKSNDLSPMWAAADKYSPVLHINEKTCPTILAYGSVNAENATGIAKTILDMNFFGEGVANDLLVPTSCYYKMDEYLQKNGVAHVGKLFEGVSHVEMGNTPETQAWLVEQSLAFAKEYL